MHPGHIAGTTRSLRAPENWSRENNGPCSSLPIRDGERRGLPHMESAWFPTPEEIAAIVAGAPVILRIVGTAHPPVALYTGDRP